VADRKTRWQIGKKRKLQLEKGTKAVADRNEGEVGCQPRNIAHPPHVVLVSGEKKWCLLESNRGQSGIAGKRGRQLLKWF
jgi:hypothetical protein